MIEARAEMRASSTFVYFVKWSHFHTIHDELKFVVIVCCKNTVSWRWILHRKSNNDDGNNTNVPYT